MSKLTVLAALSVSLVASLCCAQPEQKEGQKMPFEHGFRYDPMKWVESDESLDAALVRRGVFRKPRAGDQELLSARIEEILSEQNDDGTLSDDPRHRYQFTCGALDRLADLGVDPAREEVRRAVDVVLREKDDKSADPIGIYVIRALCKLGMGDRPEVREGLEHLVARQEEWNDAYAGCPWTPIEHLQTLWMGRDVLDSTELIGSVLAWIGEGMNAAGCLSYKDPWGFLRIVGFVDTPVAKRIVAQQVPMILRGQQPDGGWGDRSLSVYRALVTHGFLDELRGLPPLPADWRVVREIPAPDGRLETLTHDGERLWVNDRDGGQAIALSPEDGSVIKRLLLPEGKCVGIGWWDGGLAVTEADSKRLLKVDPETGEIMREISLERGEWLNGVAQVDGEVWVADGFMGCVWRVNSQTPDQQEGLVLGAPIPFDLAPTPGGVWHTDIFAPAMVKNDLAGKLIDWAEKPFGKHTTGICWDGEKLWALDAERKRICVIERTESPATARIRCEDGKVWLEGVPRPQGANSVLAVLAAALVSQGEDVTYEYLMGVSSRAFRLQFSWCPSAPHSFIGFNTMDPALKAVGYDSAPYPVTEFEGGGEEKPGPKELEAAREAVKHSIDAGVPVLLESEEESLLVGYEPPGEGTTGWLRRPGPIGLPPAEDEPYLVAVKHLYWGIRILTKSAAAAPPRRESILWSLKTAVQNAHRPDLNGLPMGFAAWEKWIAELRDFASVQASIKAALAARGRPCSDKDVFSNLCLGNAWCYESLYDARSCAPKYLRSIADECGPDAADHLRQAASHYEALAKGLTPECFTKIAPYPWMIDGDPERWSEKLRLRQAGLLESALVHERAAIAEIEKALVSD